MKFFSLLNSGPEPSTLEIEIASFFQIPHLHIVGLPAPEIQESKERIRAAILANGFEFPKRKIVVNLSPANVQKSGTGIDCAIALAILFHSDPLPASVFAWAELSLDGRLRAVPGVTRALVSASQADAEFVVFPEDQRTLVERNVAFLSRVPKIIFARDLSEAIAKIRNNRADRLVPTPVKERPRNPTVLLHHYWARILGIVASQRFHVLILGPKGIGKSQSLKFLESILVPAARDTLLWRHLISELDSTPRADLGSLARTVGSNVRPATLVGGIRRGRFTAGEFSKAHGGALFCDEIPEWPRDSIEILREPLENRTISVSRDQSTLSAPADFQLIATGNLCPCGGAPRGLLSDRFVPPCNCKQDQVNRYLRKLSGPILERMDVVLYQLRSSEALRSVGKVSTEDIRDQVLKSHEVVKSEFGCLCSAIEVSQLEAHFKNQTEVSYLERVTSLRSRHKLMRLALGLAAWEGTLRPSAAHWREAWFLHSGRILEALNPGGLRSRAPADASRSREVPPQRLEERPSTPTETQYCR